MSWAAPQIILPIPCKDWHELHPDSPLLTEIEKSLRAAGIEGPVEITRRRDEYTVTYGIVAGERARLIKIQVGHEKAAHGILADQIVSEFLKQ